jgi:hypothetical protein
VGTAALTGGALFAWSLTDGMPFPFNHYFVFIILSLAAAGGFVLSFMLTPSRVVSDRGVPGEAKGLLRAWHEMEQQKKVTMAARRRAQNDST